MSRSSNTTELVKVCSGEANGSPAKHQVAELKIPVPWGHIAARAWGDPSHEPVLALHGTMDNAASFDRLLPLLPAGRFYFVCADLPGHGRSSHLPPGALYRVFDLVTVVRMLVERLGWPRLSLLCHSLGGIVGYFFASTFPELVRKMVVIDFVSHAFLPKEYHVSLIRYYYGKLLETEKKLQAGRPPTYTLEQAVRTLMTQRPSTLSEASARTLLSRDLEEAGDGRFVFRKDQRFKWLMYPTLDSAQYVAMLGSLSCPLMVIVARHSAMKDVPVAGELTATFRRNCPVFRYELVDGGHDVHLNNPGAVAPLVMSFLYTPDSSL
ncbi:serine hydrolase-like protein isoform X1 [Bacillus rossius redtenbacheri]|uniref:serine hydrolase-like protein isoform X1 n=1 Tax=Bacillus rossius redtenbacheri TaxID=93214 RepID=UPI002FDED933